MNIYTVVERETNAFSNPMPVLIGIFFDYTRALDWMEKYINNKETYEGFDRRDSTDPDNQTIINNGIVLRYTITSVWFDSVGSPWEVIDLAKSKEVKSIEDVQPREEVSVKSFSVKDNPSQDTSFPGYRDYKGKRKEGLSQ